MRFPLFKAPLTLKNPSHSIKSISKTTSTRTTAVYLEDTLTSDEIDAANKKQLLMAETFEKLQDLGANYGECWMITWIMNFTFVVSLPFSEDFSVFFPSKNTQHLSRPITSTPWMYRIYVLALNSP